MPDNEGKSQHIPSHHSCHALPSPSASLDARVVPPPSPSTPAVALPASSAAAASFPPLLMPWSPLPNVPSLLLSLLAGLLLPLPALPSMLVVLQLSVHIPRVDRSKAHLQSLSEGTT